MAEAHGIELSLQRENWSRGPGRSPGPFLCESHRPERKREQRNLTIDLLRRMIANSIQEEVFGTLDRATLKLLDGLARRGGARRGERNLKIGTVLVRDYHGRRHTVTVESDGYVWEGTSYSSLSAIARAITGTVWNGPRFFAIKPASGNDPRLSGHRAAPPAETRRSARTRNNKNNKTSPGNPRSAICLPRKRTMTDPTARPMRCAVCSK